MKFATTPIPHSEARKLITDKPAVSRQIFDMLPDELRGRAFTITGIEDFDTLQAVRDEIARLPAGGDWDTIKKEIVAKISPWFDSAAAEKRASLLLSHHGFAAYSAAQARIMDSMTDIFPFRQYLSTGDGKVRASHAALDGIILPADHPFWEKHTPPWEWNCRCQCVELTAEDMDEEKGRDGKRDPAQRRVLGDVEQRMIAEGSLVRGPSQRVDVRTPKERGGSYEWSARDATLPYAEIRERWDGKTATAFESWADDLEVAPGLSLLDAFKGLGIGKFGTLKPRKKAVPGALIPVASENYSDAIARLDLAAKDTWTSADLGNLRAAMRKAEPLAAADLIAKISGTNTTGLLTAKEVRRTVQDVLDMLPASIAKDLPMLRIEITEKLGRNTYGDYSPGSGKVRLSKHAFNGYQGEDRRRRMRETLSHELLHWIHMDAKGAKADAYRLLVANHYAARTAGDIATPDGSGGYYRKDKWWDLYAGRQYAFESSAAGVEVPTKHFQLWEDQEKLLELADRKKNPDADEFRETFALIHAIFDKP